MSDLTEITALVNSYALLLDSGDMEAVSNLFEHATWRSAPQVSVLRGSAEVRPVYDALKTYDGVPRTKHLLTNLTIVVDQTGTTASSHCYWTVLQNLEDGGRIEAILSGQYTDRFEKSDGKWHFSDRLITADLFGDASHHVG
jgi:hypothetical protein